MTFFTLVSPGTYNVKQYGAVGDGSTDDTSAVAAANNAAATAGAGIVYFPAGTYISTTQTIQNNVIWQGAGTNASIIKLKNATNADLLSAYTSSISLASASIGSGSSTGVSRWGLADLTLDGNKANQSSGPSYPLRVYGYTYALRNVVIRNGYSGGMLTDWNGPDSAIATTASPDHAATFINCEFHDNAGIGFQAGGPADSRMLACNSYLNDSHCVHIAPNAGAFQITNCHMWGPKAGVNAVPWLIEAGYTRLSNCFGEDTDGAALVLLSNENYINGHFFAAPYGLQLGQNAGGTPYPGQLNQSAGVTTAVSIAGNIIEADFSLTNSGGALHFVNESLNTIRARIYQTSGTGVVGSPANNDNFWITVSGLTADGSLGKSGGIQFANGAFSGLLYYDASGNQVFNFNPATAILGIGNSGSIRGYSDNTFSTQQWSIESVHGNIATNGQIASGQSASAAVIATSGTISTTNVGVARVAPTGNVTGIILQAGAVAGQRITVLNESAFTLTLNTTPATSNVADSATEAAIAANTARLYVWDSSTLRWYNVRGS